MFLRMYPFVLFQVLRALECLSADRTRVGFEGRVNSEMTGDMVPLDTLDAAALPTASQTEIVGALPSHVLVAQVVVQLVWPARQVRAACPLTGDGISVVAVLCWFWL